MIEGIALGKVYGEGDGAVAAVRDVSLTIKAGEFVAIMGPSGCGKSTLLHLLGALDTPSHGDVVIGRHSVSEMSDRERTLVRRDEIGFVFQAFNLVPVLSARENVELPLLVGRRRSPKDRRRVDDLLAAVGMLERGDLLPGELSGGEQQRVAIARALTREPAAILADEPTGSLDRSTGRDVVRLLGTLNAAGQTIVVVTHDPTVATHADRVLLMRDGKLIDEVDLSSRGGTDPDRSRLVSLLVGTDEDPGPTAPAASPPGN
ncbi:MAG: ABC transporter ATP-binding protein [Actinobacteria bacterium]|nr:MAG: ABC transporter ATP-binding protein [Actinomycetota bacterium]RIK06957.1 MAG: hypothetical protein DCC48_05590 [Acidobacteriota bacterium]